MPAILTGPETRTTHVTATAGVCSGKPVIAGTRIKVSQVAREYEELGMSPSEIQEAHPHLTLAQIHGALSYYYDHSDEIQEELRQSDAAVEQLREEAGPSPLAARLRAAGKLPH